jgi:fucose 4-O-acetylase-like acetyltransferase
MSNNLQRIQWVDFAKGIGIILVVVAHAIQRDPTLVALIFVFHMPFFFVMAGYLLNTEKWMSRFEEFKSKLKQRLLLPYFLANFLFFPFWFILCHCLGISLIYDWEQREPFDVVFSIFIGNNDIFGTKLLLYPLWFLPCLFFSELLFLKLKIFFGKNKLIIYTAIIVTAAIGYFLGKFFQLPLGIDIAFFTQAFLLVGSLFRKSNCIEKINFPVCVILLLIIFFIPLLNGYTTMDKRLYSDPILFYIGGISGSILLMKFSMWASKFGNKICNFVEYCGKQSLLILTLHIPIFAVLYNLILSNVAEDSVQNYLELIFIGGGVIIPVMIAKKFGNKPILKYFCV